MDADLYKAAIEGDISGIEKLSEKIDQVTEEDGSTILHIASELGKTECMQFILTQFANEGLLIKTDRKGRTALHYAAWRGHTDAVELVINAARGLSPSSEFEKFIKHANDDGQTALHAAIGSPNTFELLINAARGFLPSSEFEKFIRHADDFGRTALHRAAAFGSPNAVELLINTARGVLPSSEFEKFIRQADWYGDTALNHAVYINKVEAVKLLVKADPNHKHSLNKVSKSPLYIAVEQGYKDIVQVICESCATPNFDGPRGKTALHAAIESPNTGARVSSFCVEILINAARGLLPSSEFEKFIRRADVNGDTALHRAVYKNQVEVVKLLVKADRNHKHSLNSSHKSLLYIAVEQGYRDIVKVLCESCATPTFDGPNGKTALHAAIGSPNTVELLINAARDLLSSSEFEKFIRHADDINGDTALDCAVERGDTDAVELLINAARGLLPSSEFEKFIRRADVNGDTALHRAVYKNQVEVVKLLVKADRNHKPSLNSSHKSLLYIAVEQGYRDIVKVLCESCATPTFDGPHGKTALHAAIESPNTGARVSSFCVEILINAARGLLPSSEFEEFIRQADEDGDTALHLAVRNNNVELVQLLVNADLNHKHPLNNLSKTQLYIAAERGYKDIVKVICGTPNFDGPNGKTALHAAIENSDTEVDAVEPINVSRGLFSSSEFEKFIRHADDNGDTALDMAVERNQVELVKLLLKVDPTHPKSHFGTPHYIAVKQGYKDIIELISTSCTTTTFDGPQGKTSLHAAAENGDKDSVRFILDKREDLILKRDDIGWTAVDYAASKNFLSVLDILIKTENNQFHNDYSAYKQFFMDRPHKETAIHRAAFEGRIFTVLQLMKLYPDFIWCAVNKDGQNILHIAVDQNYKELVQAILQYCPDLSLILITKDEKGNTPLHLLVMRGLFILELIRHELVHRNAKNNENFTPYELLYLDEEIKVDQVKIKEAFEDSELINQRWKFGLRKRNIPELITAESLVVPSTRYIKDAKFKKERNLLLKEEIKLYRERTNTQIIVTALITTVTFTVGFTMPGGYHQEEGQSNQGSAVLSKKTAFRVFMVADTIALLLSTSSLFSYFMASMYQDPHEVSKLMSASTGLNIVSIVAMMLTFITGTYVVLPSGLALTVCVISCIFFLHVIFLLIKWMYDPIEKFKV